MNCVLKQTLILIANLGLAYLVMEVNPIKELNYLLGAVVGGLNILWQRCL